MSLKYDNGTITGANFQYKADNLPLSFGRILALAGDFYANWKYLYPCRRQVSDRYDLYPESCILTFMNITDKLKNDTEGFLRCVLNKMAKEIRMIDRARRNHEDFAQVIESQSETSITQLDS